MILYNSMDVYYRNPTGAVEENTPVTITIKVARRKAMDVRLVFYKDEEMPQYILMDWVGFDKGYDIYTAKVVPDAGLYWYGFQLSGHEDIVKDHSCAMWQLTVYKKGFETPDWLKGGIIYHIFIDRFCRGKNTPVRDTAVFREDWGGIPEYKPDENGILKNNNFFGGNFAGICEKLDYIKSFGVTAIYLSPIFEAYSNHKYDTGDYTRLDPMFGDEKDFENLIRQADKRGIRVICDGVFNHTGDDSVYFNKYGRYDGVGAYQSQSSPYYGWFTFNNWNDDYDCWWGVKTLPVINKNCDEFLDFITGEKGIIKAWMKKGVSSWRLDVADELPDAMLEGIRKAAKDENPDSVIIGEVWEDASNKIAYGKRRKYLLGSQLDSVTNYPLKDAIIQFVKFGNAQVLKNVIQSQIENYPPQTLHCLMNILGTHDAMRILTVLGTDRRPETKEEMALYEMNFEEYSRGVSRLKAASLLQMFLPGVPCIYYGDEAGLQGYTDPFNRRCYPWGYENTELMRWYRKIGAIRRSEKVFKTGGYHNICAKDGIFIFERTGSGEKIVIGINLSARPINLFRQRTDILSGEVTNKLPCEKYIMYKELY